MVGGGGREKTRNHWTGREVPGFTQSCAAGKKIPLLAVWNGWWAGPYLSVCDWVVGGKLLVKVENPVTPRHVPGKKTKGAGGAAKKGPGACLELGFWWAVQSGNVKPGEGGWGTPGAGGGHAAERKGGPKRVLQTGCATATQGNLRGGGVLGKAEV